MLKIWMNGLHVTYFDFDYPIVIVSVWIRSDVILLISLQYQNTQIVPIAYKPKSIRSFIGAKDFNKSRAFYQDLGFEEVTISHNMSLFKVNDHLAFYLQDYYNRDWIENSMIFLEVEDVNQCGQDLHSRNLVGRYTGVKISPIKTWDWGREIFMHDPSGVLWHFGQFE